MPVYDYVCLDCNQTFETALSLNEHDKENPKCPRCGSKNVEKEVAAFFAVTSKKSWKVYFGSLICRRESAACCASVRLGEIFSACS